MPAHDSPLAGLEHHARHRALEVAVSHPDPGGWASLTWNELYRRAIDGAAGMIEAGLAPGQVVVVRVPAGVRQLEIELATRLAGAVPLLLPEHLDPDEVRHLLDGVEVRLVGGLRERHGWWVSRVAPGTPAVTFRTGVPGRRSQQPTVRRG